MASSVTVPGLLFLSLVLLLVCDVQGNGKPWRKSEMYAEQGTEVQLPCVLTLPQCRGLHSIKWYRGNSRIFIYSEDVGVTKGNNDIAARSVMLIPENTTNTYLKIPNLKLEDEGLYRCEATYLAVNRECNNVQHIILNVTVQPVSVRVIDENTNQTLEDGRVLGPMNEGSVITLRCESAEGRPVPRVEWFNGSKRIEAESTSEVGNNGVGVGKSVLKLQVSRDELGATFTCKVNSIALLQPLTIDIKLDVHVRPLKMDITGVVDHVVQGTKVLLECSVSAARPPANVTWYNGTELLDGNSERLEMFGTKVKNNTDSTAKTESYLSFTASEYDNGRTFSCYAENSVTLKEGIKPMKETITVEVLYPPIVTLRPENITVNETEDFVLFCDYEANPASLIKVKWFRNKEELTLNSDHYEGGITEQTALIVKNATPSDMGVYTCVLENSVGESNTQDFIEVSVLYKPVVAVTMEPDAPVNEADRLNVSLTCEVTSGNPTILTAVRWYLDGDLLKELPDCTRNATPVTTTEETATFCDIDPSKLLLEAVGRSFHGNYTCEGRNDAGWGSVSSSTSVIVHYKPGPASISFTPKLVIKKGSLNISCSVTDPGRPEVAGFKWMRGSHRLPDENKAVLTIESVNLETEANFTCMAYNEAGDGDPATTFIDVSAPPAFIKKLPPYHGYVYNSPNVSIECWVECAPICNISWIKDGVPMDFSTTSRYYLSNVYHPPDPRTNDFESIQSTLIWNLTAWPNNQLDRLEDNGKFSCESTGNDIGKGVTSSTHFHVEFPPENMTISKKVINVIVDHIPETVICGAKAHPEPTFRWFREGSKDTIFEGHMLVFKTVVPRRSNGTYYCEASNRHGSRNISTYMNVQFKPECRIDRERVDGQDYVVCSAVANPQKSDFIWSLKSDNDTLEHAAEIRDGKSYLLLDDSVTNFRTYVCIANNSIGISTPCERDVPGNVPWWLRLEGDLLVIVIAVAVIIVLVLIVICVVLFLLCHHKRSQVKYSSRVVELEEREHPDGGPPSPTVSSHSSQNPNHRPTPAPRWPLKPGVLVHVNRSHSLRSGLSSRISGNETLGMIRSTTSPDEPLATKRYPGSTDGITSVVRATPMRAFRRQDTGALNGRRRAFASQDEGVLARANKIRAMFGAQLKEPDAFPGISRGKTAVTYKRIVPQQRTSHIASSASPYTDQSGDGSRTNLSRKRKKPGADPNQTANSNHLDSVSESLPEPETKSFYENLPFHGMQAPPNKLVSPKFARVSALHGTLHSTMSSPCSSRQPSRPASPCGYASSGYESTRSHLGPHYGVHNMPRSNSPEPKYNSLKPRRRKHKHSRFYSLRLCRRHEAEAAATAASTPSLRSIRLYAIPICKNACPHKSGSSSGIDTTASTPASSDTLSIAKSSDTPPVPAPRTKKTDPSKHTYQNVPPPIFPQQTVNSTANASTNASASILETNSICDYKEHYQQQHQQQEMQQYGYPMPSNSSSQLTLPLTRSIYHSSSVVSPLQTSFVQSSNNHQLCSTMMHTHDGSDGPTILSLVQDPLEPVDAANYDRQLRNRLTAGNTSRRNDRRKHRKHERNDRKHQKQRRVAANFESRRQSNSSDQPPCDATFDLVDQELGIPESFKISYPHYYEDAIAECPGEYSRTNHQNASQHRQRNRYNNSSSAVQHYADLSLTKSRSKTSKRHTNNTTRDSRSSSTPSIAQYAEMHFRDVGQEIDV